TTVHVTKISRVADVARELEAIGQAIGRSHDAQARAQALREKEAHLRALAAVFPPVPTFVPIWRKPLMTMGGSTNMSDLLSLAGGRNVFGQAGRKYFETTFAEVRALAPEAVLLPTEPYRFRDLHRAEFAQALALSPAAVRVVEGMTFTWFGTRTLAALEEIGQWG